MGLRKVFDAVVYRDEGFYCGPGPSVAALPDGDLLVFFRGHRAWNKGILHMHYHPTTEQRVARSQDGGRTWSEPRVLAAGGQCPCVTLLKDGTLLFVTHRWEPVPPRMREQIPETPAFREQPWPHLCVGTEVWRSEDGGERWQGPFWVDDVPGLEPAIEGCHAPVYLRGFIVELSDFTLALPVYASGVGCIMVVSSDGGRTWQHRGRPARCAPDSPLAFNEWTLQETPSGELVAFMRSELPPERGGGWLHTARSSDGGHSWSEPKREELWGYPHCPLAMPSGRVLLCYGYRREGRGVRCRLLDAECAQIAEAEEFVLRDDGVTSDLGYPHACLLSDGRAMVAYYLHDREGAPPHVAVSLVEES